MAIHCFTSFSFSYLGKARALATTLKTHHPDWYFWAVISDREPEGFAFDVSKEVFDNVIWGDELFGDRSLSWIFKHDIVELCTAVKGPVLKRLLETTGAEKVFYLDPDIAVLNSLQPMVDMLDEASILLTPHQLEPDDTPAAIFDNEVASLRFGTYNLGFIGVGADGVSRSFVDWWADRLSNYCYDDPANGIFVDQKWCELVPAFFDNVKIVRDPGYNVASWNLSKRKISINQDGGILVNGSPLRFFHFTKLGPVGDIMTKRYAKDNVEVYELWSWYKRLVGRFGEPAIPQHWWKYGKYSNGENIPKEDRRLYRQREDLQAAFPNPFNVEANSFYNWLRYEKEIHPNWSY